MIGLVLGLVICVILSGAFSGLETGLYSLERVRLQVRASKGDRRAARLLQMIVAPADAVGTILVTNNVVNYFTAVFSGLLLQRLTTEPLGDVEMELRNTAWVVPVLFIFGELVPKTIFMRFPGRFVPLVYPLYEVGRILFSPVLVPLQALMRRLTGFEEGEDQVVSLLARSRVMGLLTTEDEAERLSTVQRTLVKRVLAVQGLQVRDRMVPLSRVVAVDRGSGRGEVVSLGASSGRARLLVRDPRTGEIPGYVSVLDAAFSRAEEYDLEASIHSLPRVGDRMGVTEALARLQAERRPLALVERNGRPLGIISSSDIVEALVSDPQPVRATRPGARGRIPDRPVRTTGSGKNPTPGQKAG